MKFEIFVKDFLKYSYCVFMCFLKKLWCQHSDLVKGVVTF
jgi:hypothetical protein